MGITKSLINYLNENNDMLDTDEIAMDMFSHYFDKETGELKGDPSQILLKDVIIIKEIFI